MLSGNGVQECSRQRLGILSRRRRHDALLLVGRDWSTAVARQQCLDLFGLVVEQVVEKQQVSSRFGVPR
jgi:hypothetical protein